MAVSLGKLEPRIKAIAEKYDVSPSALVQSWIIEKLEKDFPNVEPLKQEPRQEDVRLKNAIGTVLALYAQRNIPYKWSGKDIGSLKRVLAWCQEHGTGVSDLFQKYLEDDEPFVIRNGYSFSLFESRVHIYASSKKDEDWIIDGQ